MRERPPAPEHVLQHHGLELDGVLGAMQDLVA
jgi:hypothetical protein